MQRAIQTMPASTQTVQKLQLQVDQNVRVRSLWLDAWWRLSKNKLALLGLTVILVFLFMALFGRLLTPYDFLELSDSLKLWRTAPHLMVTPAVTIGLIQVAFTFFGDGLSDALNPKQNK